MNKTTDDSNDSPAPRVPEEPPVFDNAVEPADAASEPDEAEPDIEPDAPPSHPGAERGDSPAAPPPPRRGRSMVAWLALLIALGAMASSGYVAWQNRASGEDRAVNEAAIAALSSDLREAVDTLQASQREAFAERDDASRRVSQRLDSLRQEVDDMLRQSESIAPRLGNLEEAVSSLQGISAGVRDTWPSTTCRSQTPSCSLPAIRESPLWRSILPRSEYGRWRTPRWEKCGVP
jgi:uncharacterized protein HemX